MVPVAGIPQSSKTFGQLNSQDLHLDVSAMDVRLKGWPVLRRFVINKWNIFRVHYAMRLMRYMLKYKLLNSACDCRRQLHGEWPSVPYKHWWSSRLHRSTSATTASRRLHFKRQHHVSRGFRYSNWPLLSFFSKCDTPACLLSVFFK